MTAFKTVAWMTLSVAVLGTAGCDIFLGGRPREERVVVQQQPQYVEPQPQYVIVQEAPPPMMVERRPPPPSAGYLWIDGYWNWDNQRYSWQAGRYVVPPQADVVWVAPRYDRDARGYRYSPGQWKKKNQSNDRGHDRENH